MFKVTGTVVEEHPRSSDYFTVAVALIYGGPEGSTQLNKTQTYYKV